MKRLEVRKKHSAARRIFNSLLSVSSGDEALRLVLDIIRHINILIQNTIQVLSCIFISIHRIHKWRTRGKKLVPSHESEALEDKQKLQMKTFSELAECLARIPPKITLYGLLFKYNYVGCLLLLMFSSDLLFAIKRDAYIFK